MSMKCCLSTLAQFGRSRQKHSTMWRKSIIYIYFLNLADTIMLEFILFYILVYAPMELNKITTPARKH